MKKKLFSILLVIGFLFCFTSFDLTTVKADELSDSIEDQLDNIDLSELENFLNSIKTPDGTLLFENVYLMLKGQYNFEYNNVFQYIINVLVGDVSKIMPILLGVLAIAILSSVLKNINGNIMSNGVTNIIFFVCVLGVMLLLGGELISLFIKAKNLIENLAKLTQIMSPIILTLMIASGGNVSAQVYKPAVAFLSGGVINIVLSIILPLVGLIGIFSFVSGFSDSVKLNKLSDCATSTIKWVIGIIVTVFGLFLSVQGITSACYDGISLRATKYAISNSIPIIGGFLRDGFDLVVAGSVLIKNAVGVISVFALFYIVLSPIIYMAVFSLLLKLIGGIIEPFADSRICGLCFSISKTITYLTVSILLVGLMIFITILLMIFSANAFI